MNQTLFQEILNETYMRRKLKNPAFSIRAFSQRLGVNHSALCEIMSGKRKVGRKLGQRLADGLMLDDEIREQLLNPSKIVASNKVSQLRADQYKVISDWYHFAILSLMETQGFKSEVDWIAKRLRITKTEAKDAILRMERLGMISIAGSKFFATGESFSSPDGNVDLALRKTHTQYLDLALKSLEATERERRDFIGMTMAIDPKKIPEAKKRLRAFRDELCTFLEARDQKEVYQMCFQLFPLSYEV